MCVLIEERDENMLILEEVKWWADFFLEYLGWSRIESIDVRRALVFIYTVDQGLGKRISKRLCLRYDAHLV